MYGKNKEALIFNRINYIKTGDSQEIYDLKNYPDEQINLVSLQPELTGQYEEILISLKEDAEKLKNDLNLNEVVEINLDSEDLEAIKSIGYIQ